jgi:serine/threonine-protein kinase RsbW
MSKKVLIVDDYDDLRTSLTAVFDECGYAVKSVETRNEAVEVIEKESFDLIITDLDGEHLIAKTNDETDCLPDSVSDSRSHIKAFKICVPNFKADNFSEDELKNLVETALSYKTRFIDQRNTVQDLHEKIEFEIPSFISLMHCVLDYLMKRVEKNGIVKSENSNLFIALDEAFVNAVKHGNKFDAEKFVRITADVSAEEARFTIEDEGDGFDVHAIPDPLDPENLFKASGRGVLIIHNVMDEVEYNERGNRVTMVKKKV